MFGNHISMIMFSAFSFPRGFGHQSPLYICKVQIHRRPRHLRNSWGSLGGPTYEKSKPLKINAPLLYHPSSNFPLIGVCPTIRLIFIKHLKSPYYLPHHKIDHYKTLKISILFIRNQSNQGTSSYWSKFAGWKQDQNFFSKGACWRCIYNFWEV